MAVSLSIDLNNGTFADLRALVDAAETAGVDDLVSLQLEGSTLVVTAEARLPRERPVSEVVDNEQGSHSSTANPRSRFERSGGEVIGDAALRSVIDILTNRQDPPRGSN
ncbi:hypothetical protein [Corynebacterium alimapuense]|uniref:Uncharacterized protein n=1 Tax=Corynebacterium alimapuense TaxID=1576874 RepID=A0A3M8K9R5_9CORY|nr:hypothetical protein [Corynebacterium alimapuense]RNE49545.1 hypothetical protein C5L39_04125 [Corynebacterium alimapuense]